MKKFKLLALLLALGVTLAFANCANASSIRYVPCSVSVQSLVK